jgi:small-conductance mechanosensitive channel
MGDATFWDTSLLGNSLGSWAVALGLALAVLFGLRLVVRIAAAQLKRMAEGTATELDDLAADLVHRTNAVFIVVVAVWVASYALSVSPRAGQMIRAMFVLGLLVQAALWASALANHFLVRYRRRVEVEDPGVATAMGVIGFLVRVGVWGTVVLIALDTLGVDITALIAGLGVGGIAVALALQNVLGDLLASISIALDKPFVVGDFIVLGDILGTVEHVGLKTTRLRSLSGEQLVISNSDLLSSRIRNFRRMSERRVLFEVGVVYGTPSDKLRLIPGLIRSAVESRSNTRFDRSHFKAFGDSALVFESVYFMTVPDYTSYMDTQEAINLDLYERFEVEGLEFAYPTQTVYVKGGAPELLPAS